MSITFYATIDADSLPKTVQHLIPAVPVLLPASSFHRRNFKTPLLPEHVTDRAADSGGFVATFKWGDYRYSADQYVAWCELWRPRWAALMDYCCEDEITGGTPGIVQERQDHTTARAYEMWEAYQGAPWAWVPTVQGWTVADYTRHARDLAPLIATMQAAYGADRPFRVGIGTLCRRASSLQIRAIVRAVAAELPGVGLHLWGVKLGALQDTTQLPPAVLSVDSAAWNGFFGAGHQLWKTSGYTKRAYSFAVALPAYQAKVDAAGARPKQEEMAL